MKSKRSLMKMTKEERLELMKKKMFDFNKVSLGHLINDEISFFLMDKLREKIQDNFLCCFTEFCQGELKNDDVCYDQIEYDFREDLRTVVDEHIASEFGISSSIERNKDV